MKRSGNAVSVAAAARAPGSQAADVWSIKGDESVARHESAKREKVVLAYSGGLDTSVAVKWIDETYNMDVIAYTCDLGQGQDIEAIRQKALRTGAIDAIAEDARNLFVDYFVFPSLAAGALYEG